jgi:two-component system CheB/CheR fusion protein
MPVPIVGFGASAGGLEAFLEVLPGIPDNSGLAFILVQHLARNHPSLAMDILQRATPIQVIEASTGLLIKANSLYVVPPLFFVTVSKGRLRLKKRAAQPKLSTAIDQLFESLAKEEGSSALGVLLSGSGRDGVAGLAAIRAEGGVTIAQYPKSAKFPGLPTAAIEQQLADYILSPVNIGEKIVQVKGMNSWGSNRPEQRILLILRDQTQVDFTMYKEATLRRRIQRRMDYLKIATLSDYEKHLLSHPPELSALFNDLLIHVTSFFREPGFYKDLKTKILPTFFRAEQSESAAPIRIWSAGCSTGEEVYSIAIACKEFQAKRKRKVHIRIFGSDLSERAIRKARTGLYGEKAVEGLSREYLSKYFEKTKAGYRISSEIRDMCIFSKHDMTQDPPFAKMDLISCQNVMIYFKPALQKKALLTFHYALNPSGYLTIGLSESLDDKGKLFRSIESSHQTYKKTAAKAQLSQIVPAKRTASVQSPRTNNRESVETVRDRLTAAIEELQNILSAIHIPLLLIDKDRKIRKYSSEAEREFHLSPHDAGSSISILSSIFQTDMDQIFSEVLETQLSKETEVVSPSGGWRRLHLSPYRDNEGQGDGAILTIDNIDDLKAREQLSQEAFAHISSIIEAVPVALVVLEPMIELKTANAFFFEYFRLDPSCKGESLHSALQMKSDNFQKLQAAVQRALTDGGAFHELELDGEFISLGYRKFLVSGRRIQWRGSPTKEIVLCFYDVTDRQRLEAERAALLSQERLARKTAEQINQTKDVFLATLSHELRTPLASILAWAQLIRMGKVDLEKAKAGALIIEESAKTQTQLIDELLDISRIAAGKIHLNLQVLDPAVIIVAAADTVRPLCEKKNISIQIHLPKETGHVLADPVRLKQIVWNLLTNAIKFSHPGQHIDLQLDYSSLSSGKMARIQVKDHGSGIPIDFMPHLFSRFSQADSAMNRKFGGLGLGLFIVKNLVDLLRGSIHAENAPSHDGAVFIVTLPRVESIESLISPRASETISGGQGQQKTQISGLRILLLDDDDNAREAISIFLSSFGAEVSAVGNTADAFQVLELGQIDFIVSDIAMPLVDGYKFISMVRNYPSEHVRELPAIALTANASADDSKKALAAGFEAHLQKPVDIDQLVNLMATIHEKKSLAQPVLKQSPKEDL